jgi:hypothetical protein
MRYALAPSNSDGSALKGHFRGSKGLMRKQVSTQRIGWACRQIACEASRHSKTIGQDLIAVEMERNGKTYCSHYSEEGTETIILPNTLSVQGGTTQMTVSTSIMGDQLRVRFPGKIVKQPGICG